MQELLTIILTWLTVSMALPGVHDHPVIMRASAREMSALRIERAGGGFPRHADPAVGEAASLADAAEPYALYDDRTRTIYLSPDWTGATPAETSILVHELVHHLQNVEGLSYDCPEAREKPAYQAQTRWLELFGTSLEREFHLDPMTIVVRTNCMH